MMRAITFLLGLIGLLLGTASGAKAQNISPSGRSANVEVTLKTSRIAVAPGETFYVALDQKIAPGWHTYWRNPGDSGEPTDIVWTLPTGVTAGPIRWPTPTAIPFGPLVNYGFSDQVLLPVAINVPASAKVGDILALVADVRWLECADVCIPGDAKVAINVSIATNATDGSNAVQIKKGIDALPASLPGSTQLTDLGSSGLQLVIKGVDATRGAYFFPYEVKMGAIIDFAQPQEVVAGKDGFGLTLVKSPSFPTDLKGPIGGVLVLGKGNTSKAYEIMADFQAAPPGITSVPPGASPATPHTDKPTGTSGGIGLVLALAMALAGGLILNLMPCVFPILSMKALSLIEASHSNAKAARAHGLWYGGGVIFSFLALALTLIGFQSAGIAVGWGFQLQNPAIVIGLAILMVWIGFNLMGFFEFGASLQNISGKLAQSKGSSGSFLTGLLAVIVAAPCTAPFMGAALGFAATQSPLISLLVFAVLGLGFALPFIALTFSPGLLRALPRPGPWMVHLREALAFPMFATAIWLIWVASAQAGQAGILAALGGVFGAGLAVWTLRTWPSNSGKIVGAIIGLGSLIWALQHVVAAPMPAQQQATQNSDIWSNARVSQLQSEGKTVFVNFTADWCVTCKVNEAVVFSNARVQAALARKKIVYLVADWTNRDDKIAKALARHGRVGVPLYLVYKPDQAEPKLLPQILTADVVVDALN